jgi:hypothetical protein
MKRPRCALGDCRLIGGKPCDLGIVVEECSEKDDQSDNENCHRGSTHGEPPWRTQALFFEVMAVKADQLCSTLLLPQCGQMTLPFSYWASVSTFENVFLQASQKNS